MKNIMQIISLVLMCVFQGCTGPEPTSNEIIGTWVAEDGGEFQFKNDGVFTTKDLLGNVIFRYSDEYREKTFTESGVWKIERWQGQWIVDLNFYRSKNLKKGYATRIFVSGNGILENKPPWNLFLWVGEEGGGRYKFIKEQN